MTSKKCASRPDPEIDPQSQWVDLPDVIELLAKSNGMSKARIRQILLSQDLPTLTPVLDDLAFVRTVENSLVSEIAKFALMDSADAKQAFPHHCCDSAYSRCLAWPIPSLIRWMKSCKLRLTIPEDWAEWMKHDFIKLRQAGLIYSSWYDTQQQQLLQVLKTNSRTHDLQPKIIRMKHAPAHVGMNKNRFNYDVRPLLNEIKIGKRGVGFHRSELDTWAEQQAPNSKVASKTKAKEQQTQQWHSSNATMYGGPDSQHLTENEFEKALAQ